MVVDALLSDAFGTVTMTADNKETIENLIALLSASGKWEFGNYGMGIDSDDYMTIGLIDGYATSLDFTGCGWWTFANTLDYLLLNIKQYLTPTNPIVLALEKEEWDLLFEYTDCEARMMALYKQKNLLKHQANTALEETEVFKLYKKDYAYTWANQIKLEMNEISTLMELYHESIWNKDEEEWEQDEIENFLDHMKNELPEVIELFGGLETFEKMNPCFCEIYRIAQRKKREMQEKSIRNMLNLKIDESFIVQALQISSKEVEEIKREMM